MKKIRKITIDGRATHLPTAIVNIAYFTVGKRTATLSVLQTVAYAPMKSTKQNRHIAEKGVFDGSQD